MLLNIGPRFFSPPLSLIAGSDIGDENPPSHAESKKLLLAMGKSKKGGAKAAGEKASKAAAEDRGDEAEDSAAAAAEQSAGTGSKGGAKAKGKGKGKGKGNGNANGKGSKQEDGQAAAKGKAAKGNGKREADDAGPTKAEKKRVKRAAKAAEKVRAATNYWSRTHISATIFPKPCLLSETALSHLVHPWQDVSAADINAFLDANWNPDTDSEMENIEGLSDASDNEE